MAGQARLLEVLVETPMSYRVLLRTVSPWFFVLGFLSRLPYAMSPLAALVLFAEATGSLAVAGVASAVQAVAIAAASPLVGAVADRFGHRPVGAATAVLNVFALVGMLVSTQATTLWMVIAAGLAGLTQPRIGALIRVWWSRSRRFLLPTALSYEAAVDDTAFVVGPAVVGLLAPFGGYLPVVAMALLLAVAALPFALLYAAEPVADSPAGRGALPVLPLARLFVGMAFMGAIFGAIQTGVTAYATHAGQPAAAGLLYAELGIGSALAGLACGWLPARIGQGVRHSVFAGALFAGCVILVTVNPLVLGIAVVSVTVAPYMISLYALTDRLAPPDRAALAITILCAGGPLGTATANVVAGALADAYGPAAAFSVAPTAALLAFLLTLPAHHCHRTG